MCISSFPLVYFSTISLFLALLYGHPPYTIFILMKYFSFFYCLLFVFFCRRMDFVISWSQCSISFLAKELQQHKLCSIHGSVENCLRFQQRSGVNEYSEEMVIPIMLQEIGAEQDLGPRKGHHRHQGDFIGPFANLFSEEMHSTFSDNKNAR